MAEKDKLLFFCLLVLLFGGIEVQGSRPHRHHHNHHHRRRFLQFQKLFVFGDSYADTGNIRKSLAKSWKEPYGITFPGNPTGRFSDGRVMTDFLASIVGIRSPIPYQWKDISQKALRYGMNFAFGGTGVFDTLVPFPNMTTQIDMFQQLIEGGVYTKQDLQFSIAFVSVVGNDYTTFQARNGSVQDVPAFITSLISKLALDLKRINDLGIKRIAVTGLQPLGCLPSVTMASSYQQCNDTLNQAANLHNLMLENAVGDLNKNGNGSSFVIFDLFKAFSSILQNPDNQGAWKFENPLTPCCKGISSAFSCGNVDGNGTQLYTVCATPNSSFFWDEVHPTQTGWAAMSSSFRTSLYNISS